LVSSW